MNIQSRLARAEKSVRERKNIKYDTLGYVFNDPLWVRWFFKLSHEKRWTLVVDRCREFLATRPDLPRLFRSRIQLYICLAREKVASHQGELTADLASELINVVRGELAVEDFPDRWRGHLADFLWRVRGDFERAIRDSSEIGVWKKLVDVDTELNQLRPAYYPYELALTRSSAWLTELKSVHRILDPTP